jgi:hypothetical protein
LAEKSDVHEASASATGYLYQCRIALLAGLRAIPASPNLSISIEKFDDVAFDREGTPAEMIQVKHHVTKTGNLTNASSDLWNTLLIWTKAVIADVEVPFKKTFILMTTGMAPAGSAAFYLRPTKGTRDEQTADAILRETVKKSKSANNAEAYALYMSLTPEMRLSFLKAVTVLDNSPDIVDTMDELKQALYYAAPKEQIGNLLERLEGWWFAKVITAMVNKESIPVLAIDQRVDDLREEFKRNSLPVDFKSSVPSPDVIAELDNRPFVEQLRRIQIGRSRIEYAIRDYYRASEQRSRWLRQDLLLDGELDKYEQDLREAWEPRFAAAVESLPRPCSPGAKILGGQQVFRWAEQDADFPLRSVRERFLTHGSYHILANRKIVGWHPDFALSDGEVDGNEMKK